MTTLCHSLQGIPTFPDLVAEQLAFLDPAAKRVVFGIGGAVTDDDLRSIASRPTDEVFMVPTFGGLREFFASDAQQATLLRRVFGYVSSVDEFSQLDTADAGSGTTNDGGGGGGVAAGKCAYNPSLFHGTGAARATTTTATSTAPPATATLPPLASTDAAGEGGCKDNFPTDCQAWASLNYCESSHAYMQLHCPASCGWCPL